MENPSLWQIFKKALSHFLDSKTNFWLFYSSLLAALAFFVILAIYGDVLIEQLFLFLGGNTAGGVIRASIVDGAPKIAAANRDPNSLAANPPPAVSELQIPRPLPAGVTDPTPTNFSRPPL